MSHSSDQTPLSQPLKVDTDDGIHPETSYYEKDPTEEADSLGPLPPKWEKAYTESGEVYFIDHSTGTSHWLDPRLSKFQKKSLEDCLDDELPYGWEKISDPNYGTYFIDHVNRRTQYENPVIQAKRAASQASARVSRTSFTKDPSELCGQRFRTSLVKSSRGLGFTIIGGDDSVDEFLQIKSVVPKGPAWLDGQLQTGDVIVFVNETCVLGYTHIQIVRLFQSINVGSTVSLQVCRGYPLPFDPNDPNTEVVTTIAVDSHLQQVPPDKRLLDTNYNFLDGDDLSREEETSKTDEMDEIFKGNLAKSEVRVRIVKGNLGFGFTIADSACGQRVKQILDRQRCKNLMEGDILIEINEILLTNMSHDEVVQVLKNCPYNSEATICVHRGATTPKTTNIRNKLRKLENRFGGKDINNAFRSKTPTADIYSTQTREVLPTRPKTPLVDTRSLTKTPIKDFNQNSNSELYGESFSPDRSRLRLSLIDNPEDEDDIDISESNGHNKPSYEYPPPVEDPKYSWGMPMMHHYDCACYNCVGRENCDEYTKKNDYAQYMTKNYEYVTSIVVLHKQETGFGFRIVGGIEDKSQVAVGHIVVGGAADIDGTMKSGDEIISVDGQPVVNASHREVVQLMNAAAGRGQVTLKVRRRRPRRPQPTPPYPGPLGSPEEIFLPPLPTVTMERFMHKRYDVVVSRNENEGFGFVIISSANKEGSTIGRLIEGSPAEKCGRLRVGDHIIAVNHTSIATMSHNDVVNMIKVSGLSVTLTIDVATPY